MHRIHYSEPVVDGHHHWNSFWSADIEAVSFGRGGYWYHKLHIYLYPFYYINYTLTTMGAMEFKTKDRKNHEDAWKDYLNLCKCGGSMSYLETLRYAHLMNPFEQGTVEKAIELAKNDLLNSKYM